MSMCMYIYMYIYIYTYIGNLTSQDFDIRLRSFRAEPTGPHAMASARGRDRQGFRRRATDSLQFAICCVKVRTGYHNLHHCFHILQYFARILLRGGRPRCKRREPEVGSFTSQDFDILFCAIFGSF